MNKKMIRQDIGFAADVVADCVDLAKRNGVSLAHVYRQAVAEHLIRNGYRSAGPKQPADTPLLAGQQPVDSRSTAGCLGGSGLEEITEDGSPIINNEITRVPKSVDVNELSVSKMSPSLSGGTARTPQVVNSSEVPKGTRLNIPNKVYFDRIWNEYPSQKRGPVRFALEAWARLNPDPALCEIILAGLDNHLDSKQWSKDSGQYVPKLPNWLERELWRDELEAEPPPFDVNGKDSPYPPMWTGGDVWNDNAKVYAAGFRLKKP